MIGLAAVRDSTNSPRCYPGKAFSWLSRSGKNWMEKKVDRIGKPNFLFGGDGPLMKCSAIDRELAFVSFMYINKFLITWIG